MNLRSSSRPVIGGIGHGDGERAALALERQHDALGGHVGRDQLDDLGIDLEAREVHRRHAVLAGEDLGDLELLDQPELHQDVAQPVLGGLLLRERLRELLARDQAFAQQDFAEPIAAGRCGRHDLVVLRAMGVRGNIGRLGPLNLSPTSTDCDPFRSRASSRGPNPGTRASSSTAVNGPCRPDTPRSLPPERAQSRARRPARRRWQIEVERSGRLPAADGCR